MKKFIVGAIISSVIGIAVLSFLFFNTEEVKEETIFSVKINAKKVILESNPVESAPRINFEGTNQKGFVIDGEVWVEKEVPPEYFFLGGTYEELWVKSLYSGFEFRTKKNEERIIYKTIFSNNDVVYRGLTFFRIEKISNSYLENSEIKTKYQEKRTSLGLITLSFAWFAFSLLISTVSWIASDIGKRKKAIESAKADAE